MLFLIMPYGKSSGWDICGRYLARELARRTDVRLVSDNVDPKATDNPLEQRFLTKILARPEDVALLERSNGRFPVLQAISNRQLEPYHLRTRGSQTVGYAFFEALIPPRAAARAADYFQVIAVGSDWCREVLGEHGLKNVVTVVQGIDPLIFNPSFADKELLRDEFVIFSGGKFEYRKGQDIVIRAFRILQDKHPDVLLACAWHNRWPVTMQSMVMSRHIRYEPRSERCGEIVQQVLADNGIDPRRVLVVPACEQETMARVYQNTDVGLFPNRCEGGTNLVLMEYMACGKPVIASYSSGHRDILTDDTALCIRRMRPVRVERDGHAFAVWDNPDLDETVAALEWAYQNRNALRDIGCRAGRHLAQFTWRQSAEQFLQLLGEEAVGHKAGDVR